MASKSAVASRVGAAVERLRSHARELEDHFGWEPKQLQLNRRPDVAQAELLEHLVEVFGAIVVKVIDDNDPATVAAQPPPSVAKATAPVSPVAAGAAPRPASGAVPPSTAPAPAKRKL